MVATRSSDKPKRPASARRHAFVTKTTGGLTEFETAHLFGSRAAYGKDDQAERSLFRNGWVHDHDHSTKETNVFHKGRHTMVAFRGSKSMTDWVRTDRRILANQEMDQDERFVRSLSEAADVFAAYPNQKHSYTGHSLGGTIAHFVHRAMDGNAAVAFNPGTSPLPTSGMRTAMLRTAKNASKDYGQHTPKQIAAKSVTHHILGDPFSAQSEHSFPGSQFKQHQVALKHGHEVGHTLRNFQGHFHPTFVQAE